MLGHCYLNLCLSVALQSARTIFFVYSESVARVNEVTEDFFKRPSEKKRKYQRDPEQNFGYVGIEAER